MTKFGIKSAVMSFLSMGLMVAFIATSTAPSALARDRRERCDNNSGYSRNDGRYNDRRNNNNAYYINDRYDNNRYDNNRYDSRYDNNVYSGYNGTYVNRYDDDRYDRDRRWDRDREDTAGKTARRVGIGAAIGAGGGALIGGKKGAIIGAGIGAAGGYIYHQRKVSNQRNNNNGRFRWPF